MKKMTFYTVEGEHINQHSLSFDENTLREFREKVINACSIVTHVDKQIKKSDIDLILSKKRRGYRYCFPDKEYRKFDYKLKRTSRYSSEDEYRVTYYEYQYSRLVRIIDGILLNSISSVYDLLSYNPTTQFEKTQTQMDELEQEIESLDNLSPDKIQKLIELQALNNAKLQNKHKEETECQDELIKLLNIKHVKSYSIEDVLDILEFVGVSENVTHDPVLKRLRSERESKRKESFQATNPEENQ